LQSEVDKHLGIQRSGASALPVATYSRVSSHEQKQKGDLERQEGRVLAYCVKHKYSVLQSFIEVGSGMNDNRPKLHALIKLVTGRKISKVVIEHKDRLTRFNLAIYQAFFNSHGVDIEWTSESLPKSSESELVEDIISLMSSCSAKIYGRRSAERRKAKKAEEIAVNDN
jgi:putative resolvase